MDELTANISFDKFADMPEFYGSGAAGYRLAMVKDRGAFLDLFEGAHHVDAVTYAETPELMVKMLTEYGIGSLDVLIGNSEDYEDQVSEVPTARSLVQLRQDGRLTIRLKNRKTVHSKIYRIVMPDDTVKLVHGSANLSRNSWEYHTNQISVFTTTVGTELDEEFETFIDEYRKAYSDQTLLEGLIEALEEADSPEERENRIEYWVGTGDLDMSDTAALNQDAVEDLKEIADRVTAVVDNPGDADETVAFVEDPMNADRNVIEPGDSTGEDDSDESDDTDFLPRLKSWGSSHRLGGHDGEVPNSMHRMVGLWAEPVRPPTEIVGFIYRPGGVRILTSDSVAQPTERPDIVVTGLSDSSHD